MVINTNEERLCTIEQIERFLSASVPIEFSASGDDSERYADIPQKYAQPINAFYLSRPSRNQIGHRLRTRRQRRTVTNKGRTPLFIPQMGTRGKPLVNPRTTRLSQSLRLICQDLAHKGLDTFNAWLNPHRPCLFATSVANAKGKLVKRYKHEDGKTPLECLVQLSAQGLVTLKDSVTLDALQARARTQRL